MKQKPTSRLWNALVLTAAAGGLCACLAATPDDYSRAAGTGYDAGHGDSSGYVQSSQPLVHWNWAGRWHSGA